MALSAQNLSDLVQGEHFQILISTKVGYKKNVRF